MPKTTQKKSKLFEKAVAENNRSERIGINHVTPTLVRQSTLSKKGRSIKPQYILLKTHWIKISGIQAIFQGMIYLKNI